MGCDGNYGNAGLVAPYDGVRPLGTGGAAGLARATTSGFSTTTSPAPTTTRAMYFAEGKQTTVVEQEPRHRGNEDRAAGGQRRQRQAGQLRDRPREHVQRRRRWRTATARGRPGAAQMVKAFAQWVEAAGLNHTPRDDQPGTSRELAHPTRSPGGQVVSISDLSAFSTTPRASDLSYQHPVVARCQVVKPAGHHDQPVGLRRRPGRAAGLSGRSSATTGAPSAAPRPRWATSALSPSTIRGTPGSSAWITHQQPGRPCRMPRERGRGTGRTWERDPEPGSYLLEGRFCHVRATCKNATGVVYPSTNTLIATLPAGARPLYTQVPSRAVAFDTASHVHRCGDAGPRRAAKSRWRALTSDRCRWATTAPISCWRSQPTGRCPDAFVRCSPELRHRCRGDPAESGDHGHQPDPQSRSGRDDAAAAVQPGRLSDGVRADRPERGDCPGHERLWRTP